MELKNTENAYIIRMMIVASPNGRRRTSPKLNILAQLLEIVVVVYCSLPAFEVMFSLAQQSSCLGLQLTRKCLALRPW